MTTPISNRYETVSMFDHFGSRGAAKAALDQVDDPSEDSHIVKDADYMSKRLFPASAYSPPLFLLDAFAPVLTAFSVTADEVKEEGFFLCQRWEEEGEELLPAMSMQMVLPFVSAGAGVQEQGRWFNPSVSEGAAPNGVAYRIVGYEKEAPYIIELSLEGITRKGYLDYNYWGPGEGALVEFFVDLSEEQAEAHKTAVTRMQERYEASVQDKMAARFEMWAPLVQRGF